MTIKAAAPQSVIFGFLVEKPPEGGGGGWTVIIQILYILYDF